MVASHMLARSVKIMPHYYYYYYYYYYYLPLTTYHLLLTTYYSLLVTHYLLPHLLCEDAHEGAAALLEHLGGDNQGRGCTPQAPGG